MSVKKHGQVIQEGMVKKGGLNPKPSTPRPQEPPKAQSIRSVESPKVHSPDNISK